MKNSAIFILMVATVVFSGLYLRENNRLGNAETTIANLQTNLAELQAELGQQESRTANLQTRLKSTRERAVANADEVNQLQQTITNQAAQADKNPISAVVKGVGEMF